MFDPRPSDVMLKVLGGPPAEPLGKKQMVILIAILDSDVDRLHACSHCNNFFLCSGCLHLHIYSMVSVE